MLQVIDALVIAVFPVPIPFLFLFRILNNVIFRNFGFFAKVFGPLVAQIRLDWVNINGRKFCLDAFRGKGRAAL